MQPKDPSQPHAPSKPPSQPLPDRARPPAPRGHARPRPLASVPSLHVPTLTPTPAPASDNHAPRPWSDCFDTKADVALPARRGTWRVYTAGMRADADLALILLHGGGHSALSWSLVASRLKPRVPVVAFDARGHGHSVTDNDADLSADTQLRDAAALIQALFERVPRIVLCGHSMGGAVAVRLAAAGIVPSLVGLVVVDVVEGTAMSALPYMSSWLQARTTSFPTVERAIRYVTKAGHVRNLDSARLSVPPQLTYSQPSKRWVWRTRLEESEQYWRGWFEGLSLLFLSVPAAKLLVLANVDRLDKDLMIAQMQGKFQNILIPAAGHTVHEDQPDQTARVLLDYLERNMFLSPETDDADAAIFQQRRPIPPCC